MTQIQTHFFYNLIEKINMKKFQKNNRFEIIIFYVNLNLLTIAVASLLIKNNVNIYSTRQLNHKLF